MRVAYSALHNMVTMVARGATPNAALDENSLGRPDRESACHIHMLQSAYVSLLNIQGVNER